MAWLDLSRSFDPVEAVARGVRLEWLVVITPETLDEGLAIGGALLAGRSVDLLVLDLPGGRLAATDRPARIADRLGRLAALARRSETLLVVLEPPGLAGGLATAVAESTGLRLELARRSWIRLGRDIVGQRTEALVARNRYGPPGRRATLRILYAEGGERDACLRRDDLLLDQAPDPAPAIHRTDPPRCDSSTSTGRTSPSSSPGREPPSPSRPARSSWAAGRGIRARSSTRTRKPGRWASGEGCRSGAPIGSSLRRPSSTRIPTRTGRPSRPPSRRSRRSARGSPAAPTRSMPRSGCSRSRSMASSRCGDRSRSSSSGWSRRSARALGEGTGGGASGIRAGIAGTRFSATVAAVLARPGAPNLVPPGGEADFLAPHPSGLLTPDPDVRARLTRFGLRRIGAVAELDRTALVARFGEEGARIHARARGEELEPFRPRRAPERLRLGAAHRARRSRISSRSASSSIGWPPP